MADTLLSSLRFDIFHLLFTVYTLCYDLFQVHSYRLVNNQQKCDSTFCLCLIFSLFGFLFIRMRSRSAGISGLYISEIKAVRTDIKTLKPVKNL